MKYFSPSDIFSHAIIFVFIDCVLKLKLYKRKSHLPMRGDRYVEFVKSDTIIDMICCWTHCFDSVAVTLTMGLVRAHWQWSQSPLAAVAVAMVWPGPGWWLQPGTQLETHMIQHLHSTAPLPASPAQFNVTTTCTIAISANTTSTMGRHFIINVLITCK